MALLLIVDAVPALLHSTNLCPACRTFSDLTGLSAKLEGMPKLAATLYGSMSLLTVFLLYLAFGPLRVMVNIIADILFYILPSDQPLSIQRSTRERFSSILTLLNKEGVEPVVVAYSQGSMIAYDVLTGSAGAPAPTVKIKRLVTVGSPVASLYRGFVNWPKSDAAPANEWLNGFRHSDVIGGEIPEPQCRNFEVVDDYDNWHYDYFVDRHVMREVVR
jgi:hypothetical protein